MADKAAGGHDEQHESSSFIDSVKEKVSETFHGSGSSSSDSEGEGKGKDKLKAGKKDYPIPIKKKVQSLSWKEKPVHDLLGGGKPADVLLWRDKKTSIGVLGVATIIWALFELIEYHLLSLVCHILILVLGIHFLWSNTFNLFYRCPQFPEVAIEKDTALRVASILRSEINKALEVLREIASGKDLKEFLAVIAGLWVVSIAGNWCNLLTLVYICFVLLQMVPILYEKNKSQADVILGKAEGELKKHFEVVSEKVLSKVPSMSSREKKAA